MKGGSKVFRTNFHIIGIFFLTLTFILSGSIANAFPPSPVDIQLAIDNGLDWLCTNQYVDLAATPPWGCWGDSNVRFGGFDPSDPNGDVGVTALCVWALIDEGVTEADPPGSKGDNLRWGIQYLTNHVRADGAITNVGAGTVNYHTSMSIIALFASHNPGAIHTNVGSVHGAPIGPLTRADIIANARAYLESTQFVPPHGPPPFDIAHGGWTYDKVRGDDDCPPDDTVNNVDVIVRDNSLDIGCIPTTPPFWTSPDIWVDNNGDDKPDLIIPNADNNVFVRVWNRGDTASGIVEVNVYCTPPHTALMLPTATPRVGSAEIPSIGPGESQIVEVTCNIPDLQLSACCLGVIVQTEGDVPQDTRIALDNNLAARNMICLMMPDDAITGFPIVMGNPENDPITAMLRIAPPPDIAWEFTLDNEIPQFTDNGGHKVYWWEVELPSGDSEHHLTIKPKINNQENMMTEIVIEQEGPNGLMGGYTIMAQITTDITVVEPIAPCPPMSKRLPDLSNTQWCIMAMAFTEDPIYGGSSILTAPWAAAARIYVDRTQQSIPDPKGRGFDYHPHPEEDPSVFAYGSMTYAGIWSHALMETPSPWPSLADRGDARLWTEWHYSAFENPNWGQSAYYYYAVSMAKALQLSYIPYIYDQNTLTTRNWYLDLAEELVPYAASPSGIHKQETAPGPDFGSWVNTPSPDFGEHSKELCTAYAILVLQTKHELCCIVKIILDKPANNIDFSVRDYLSRLIPTDIPEDLIPGSRFEETDTQYIITLGLPVGEEDCTLEPETYRIILQHLDAQGVDEQYNLKVEISCDEEIIFEKTFGNRTIEPGQHLVSNLNLSTIAGQTTAFLSEPTEMSVFVVPDEVALELSECDNCLKGEATFDISSEGNETIYDVTLAVVSETTPTDEISGYFKFEPNGFDLATGETETVRLKSCIPPEIDINSLQPVILAQARNAETAVIPLTIDVISTVISVGSDVAGPGDQLWLPVSIQHGNIPEDIVSVELDVSYDETLLNATDARPAGIASDWQMIEFNVANGKIAMVAEPSQSDPNPLQGDGMFMQILFEVSENLASRKCAVIHLERARLNEYDDLRVGLCDGEICYTCMLGDMDGDGQITAFDASLVLQVVVGLRQMPDDEYPCLTLANADVSGNGVVTAYDCALILQRAVGLIPEFPAQTNPAPSDNIQNYYVTLGDAQKHSGRLIVPVIVDDASGVLSGELTLNYDSTRMKPVGASSTSLTTGYSVLTNRADGQLLVTFAGANPLSGSGSLVNLEFETLDGVFAQLPLTLAKVQINEKGITTIKSELVRIIPDKMALLQNFPNPFNPETWIPYQLSKPNDVQIRIFNVSGQLVRTLSPGYQRAGVYADKNQAAYWNGRNETSERVSSGVYFYTIQAGDFSATRKMLIAK